MKIFFINERYIKYICESNSKPIVYHGSNMKFNKFDIKFFGQTDEGYYGKGFYFTPDLEVAEEYGKYIYKCQLLYKNPFTLPYASEDRHISLLNARTKLQEIYPEKKILPNTKLPQGYKVKQNEDGMWEVWPKAELYDTDREIYGEEMRSKVEAIVYFNDKLNDVNLDVGWLSSLLKKIGRNTLTKRLEKKGYDCLIIEHYKYGASEYIMWDSDKIKIIERNGID